MATWKRLRKFLEEMAKVDRATHFSPSPVFWKDEDKTGIYRNKSELRGKKK